MEDRSLFSFDFIVEKISNIRGKCLCPGMAFLLMDFSPVLVHLQQPLDCSNEMGRGKSCLMAMGPQELLKELRERGAEVVFLDLQCEGSNPKVIGRAPLNLSTIIGSLEEAVRANKLRRDGAVFCAGGRQSVHVLDTAGGMVATVLIKHRLSTVDSAVRNHIRENQNRMEPSRAYYTTNAPKFASAETSQEELSDNQIRTTLAVNASPKQQLLRSGECTELSTSPALSGSGRSAGNVSKEDSDAEEEPPERLAMYLLNSVCPPPLLYRSESPSHVQKSKLCSGTAVDPVDQTDKELLYFAGNTAANHWSVVMAHDHCTYPITVTQNELKAKSSDEVKSTPPAVALPLLTALLEELSVLKSHIELPQATDRATASPKRELPEKATKCLQTDDIPDRVSTVCKVKKEKPPQPAKVQGQFVRECCLRKHGYSDARRVPKNKSVIYPPDIARNRRNLKSGTRKPSNRIRSVIISERSSAKSIKHETVEGRKIVGQNTATMQSKVETREASPPNSLVAVEEIVSSPTVRKLEVFVPQVSYTARSSEANTPALGSGASLHLAGDPDERLEAQTQNVVDLDLHKTTKEHAEGDTTPTSVSLESVFKSSKVEVSSQASSKVRRDSGTDHEACSEINEEQSTSVHVSTTHSRTAAENINFVITRPSRRGSLQLSHEQPSPIPTRTTVDDSAAVNILSLPIGARFKPGSLLSIGSQAAYDSLMSIDSLDIADSAVLPKHRRESCVVYLATSQSSVEIGGSGDRKDSSVSEVGGISTQEDSCLEEYSDDFEQLSTGSSSSSDTTAS